MVGISLSLSGSICAPKKTMVGISLSLAICAPQKNMVGISLSLSGSICAPKKTMVAVYKGDTSRSHSTAEITSRLTGFAVHPLLSITDMPIHVAFKIALK